MCLPVYSGTIDWWSPISRTYVMHIPCLSCAYPVPILCISRAYLVHIPCLYSLCISCAYLVHIPCLSCAYLVPHPLCVSVTMSRIYPVRIPRLSRPHPVSIPSASATYLQTTTKSHVCWIEFVSLAFTRWHHWKCGYTDSSKLQPSIICIPQLPRCSSSLLHTFVSQSESAQVSLETAIDPHGQHLTLSTAPPLSESSQTTVWVLLDHCLSPLRPLSESS